MRCAVLSAVFVACSGADASQPAPPSALESNVARTSELVDLPPPPTVTGTASEPKVSAARAHPGLMNPSLAVQRAPDVFTATLSTTAGPLAFACERKHAPLGVDRFFSLINIGYFKDVMFFRVVTTPRPFVVQFGIHAEPRVNAIWRHQKLAADPVVLSNTKGTLTFAQAGTPDTRTTQLLINLADNTSLDGMGFAPICKLTPALTPLGWPGEPDVNDTTLSRISSQHGDRPTAQQERIQTEGNAFLNREFPNLDFITEATTSSPAVP